MDIMESVRLIVMVVAVGFLVAFAARALFLWYFRINRIVELLEKIAGEK